MVVGKAAEWGVASSGALVLALCIAMVAATGWLSLFGGIASADAASRATMLARGISESMNFMGFSVVLCCVVTCGYYGYRFFIAKPPL